MSKKSACSFKSSFLSTKSFFVRKGFIDAYQNIKDINGFRKANKYWSERAQAKYGTEGTIFNEQRKSYPSGEVYFQASPNMEVFAKIDEIRGTSPKEEQLSLSLNQISSTENSGPIESLDRKITSFLNRLGIKVNSVKDLKVKDTNGAEVDAIAVAKLMQKVINVAEGKAKADTLGEEAAHFLVELLGDHPLVTAMLKDISNYEIYEQVLSEYVGIEGYDDLTLRKEAVGKMIAKILVAKETGEKFPQKQLSWFDAFIGYIKNLFKRISSAEIREAISPFEVAANKILESDISGLSFDNYSKNTPIQMYELSDGQKASRDALLKRLSEKVLTYNNKTKAYYRSVDGRRVTRRVHDYIKEFNRKLFNRPDRLDERALRSANAGVVIHKVMEITFNKRWNNESLSYNDIIDEAIFQLKEIPEFANKPDEFFKGIMKQAHFRSAVVKTVDGVIQQIKDAEKRIAKVNGIKESDLDPQVFTEVMLYDTANDLAGTVDLLVVHSNGAVSKFDWKSMIYEMVGKQTVNAPAWYKRANWNQQLAIYDNILSAAYGVTDFAMSRIIPINIQFAKDNTVYSMSSAYTQANNPHLSIVPTSTERTDNELVNKKINDLATKLNDLATVYKDAKDKVAKGRLLEKINRISETLKRLQVSQDFGYVYEELKKINKYIKDREQELEYTNAPDNTEKNPNYLDLGVLNDLSEYVELFRGFSVVALEHLETVKDTMSETEYKDKQLQYALISNEIDVASHAISTKSVEQLVERTGIDFTKPTKKPGFLARWFSPLSHFEHPVLKALSKIVTKAFEDTRFSIQDLAKTAGEKSKALKEWANANGMSELDAYKKLYNSETGKLHYRYGKKFYEDLSKAREKKDVKWLLKYAEIKATTVDEHTKYEYTGNAKDRFLKAREWEENNLKKRLIGNDKEVERRMKAWDKKHDVSKSYDALFDKGNEFVELNFTTTDYNTDEWNYIQENAPLKDFYDFFTNTMMSLNKLVEVRIDRNFVPNINQSMIDKIMQSGLTGLGDLGSTFLQSMQLQQDDIYRGALENSNSEKVIPLAYYHEQREPLSSSEKEEVKSKLLAIRDKDGNQMFVDGTEEFTEELNYAITQAEYAKARKNKSVDLSKTLVLFADSVYMHSALSDSEGAIKSLRAVITDRGQKSLAVDKKGRPKLDAFTHDYAITMGISEGEIEVFDRFVDMYFYGIKGGQGDFVFEAFGREWSTKKLYQQFMKYIAVRQMGLSPLPAFSNIVGGKMNIMMLGAEGLYFTNKQFKKSQKRFINRDPKTIAALNWLQPFSHDISNELARKLSANKMSQALTVDNMFVWYRQGDNMMSSDVGLSMMENYGVDPSDGIAKPLEYLKDKSVKPLIEVATINEDGSFSVPGLSAEGYTHFRKSVMLVVNKAIGSMSEEDKNLAQSNLLIATVMMFKNWIPGLGRTRFSKFGKNSVDVFDVGRFNVLMGEFTDKGVAPKLKAFTELLLEVTLCGFNSTKVNEAVSRKFYQRYLTEKRMTESELSFEQFRDLRIKKLRGMGMELRVYLAFLLLVLGAKAMLPPDKDDPLRKPAVLAFRMVNRSLLEVSFFLDPRTINQVGGNAIPPIRLLNDTYSMLKGTYGLIEHSITGEKIKKSQKTLQWGYKSVTFIPGVKAFYDVMDIYDKYNPNSSFKY